MIDCGPLLLKYRGLNGRLKIGVVLSGSRSPSWVRSLIELLGNVAAFEVLLFVAGNGTLLKPSPSSGLADRLYNWSRRVADPYGQVDLDLGEAVEAIRARRLDLLCW